MESSLILEYTWTLFILIGLEGLLSADNALVLAVIAKHLPDTQKKQAIDLGIYMAFAFRFIAIFFITFIADIWEVQAGGAAYLIYLGGRHIYNNICNSNKSNNDKKGNRAGTDFWATVLKIGFSDIAFAIDSILAAVAMAITLPKTPIPKFGGLDGGKFVIIVFASIVGLILVKFAANWFVELLNTRPGLETTAYLVVAWVGVKLAVITLAHGDVAVLPEYFPYSTGWTITFWGVLLGIAIIGWILSGEKDGNSKTNNKSKS